MTPSAPVPDRPVTVGICTRNRRGSLLRGLRALRHAASLIDRVIVVDYGQGIQDLAAHLVELGHTRLVFLAGPERSAGNQGFYPNWVSFEQLDGCDDSGDACADHDDGAAAKFGVHAFLLHLKIQTP